MKVVNKLCLLGLLCWSHLALSQSFTNPLDIEGREPDTELLQDSSYQQAVQSLQNATTEGNSEAGAENPFDVSHIPLKKTEVNKSSPNRAKKTSTQRKKSKKRTVARSNEGGLSNFLLWIMVGLLVYFAGIMYLFREEIFNLIKPLFNLNYLKSLNRESNGGKNPLFLSLYLFFLINLGLLIYGFIKDYIEVSSGIQLLWMIVLSTLGIYIVKHVYIYFMRWVFPLRTPLSHYGFAVVVLNAIVGILLFPVNLLAVLGPENLRYIFLILGLIIVLVFYLTRLFQGFQLSARESSNNIFHFFLYLCGSEIAPIALVYGFINQGF